LRQLFDEMVNHPLGKRKGRLQNDTFCRTATANLALLARTERMIRKSAERFSERHGLGVIRGSCANKKPERDDDPSSNHRAL
jgi:hypothetical protein